MEEQISDIVLSCISEYKDYTFDRKQDFWATVSLKAPEQIEDEEKKERAGIDLVAVMDISGSMAGEKLANVKDTLEFILTQLTEKDRLSLITFENEVEVVFKLINMTNDNKSDALKKVKDIYTKGCTNLSGGLFKGIDEIHNRSDDGKNEVSSILLFTDGCANRGIMNTSEIVTKIKKKFGIDSPKKVKVWRDGTRQSSRIKDGDRKRKSDGSDGSPSEEKRVKISNICADTAIYTFGFGQDTDTKMLKDISEAGNGMYYFIETKEKIGESFAHCLGGLMSTVAQKINLSLQFEKGITIKEIHSARTPVIDGLAVSVNVGDMQSEESRDVVLEICLQPEEEPNIAPGQLILNAKIDYFNVITKEQRSATASLHVQRPREESSRDDSNVDIRVTKEMIRIEMNKAMKDADQKANLGRYEDANQILTRKIDTMSERRKSLVTHYDEKELSDFDAMIKDLEECRTNTKSANVWQTKGHQMQQNMMQQYSCQRSANASGKMYQTKSKSSTVSKCKQFKR